MLLTKFRPDFTLEVLATGLGFKATSGSAFFFDFATHKLGARTRSKLDIPIKPALAFELGLVRLLGPLPQLSTSDWHDTTPNSHTTGGGRRSYIAPAFEFEARCLFEPAGVIHPEDGREALISWAHDQGQRPVAWWPWWFSYSDYFGELIGPAGVSLWKYDQVDVSGWNIFDPAHLESSALFGGAALGIDECLAHFTMLLAWVCSSFPGQLPGRPAGQVALGWTGSGQPRAIGWMLQFLARACLLGFDTCDPAFRDTFLARSTPKQHLVGLVRALLEDPPSIGADRPDERTMVDFGNGEIRGALGFQEAILFAGIGYLLRTGILNEPLSGELRAWAHYRALEVARRATSASGLAYAFSRSSSFTQADADRANELEKDPGHRYELEPNSGGVGFIRDTPRVADSELMAGGLALLEGTSDPTCQALLALMPELDDVDNYRKVAPYLDVFYGLAENGN